MNSRLIFDDDIESQHRHIDTSNWDEIYVIGDVHGCRRELDRLLAELRPTADDLIVFVGDLLTKGPNDRGVVDLVRTTENMCSVRGNNEEKLLRGEKSLPELTEDDLDWIASLPVVVSWKGAVVTHAGIDPRKPVSEHTIDDLQTIRSLAPDSGYEPPYWFDEYEEPPRVFFGHTVLENPFIGTHAVGLDTGCVYGGALTAYDVRRDETISIDASRAYQERSPSKFLSVSRPTI